MATKKLTIPQLMLTDRLGHIVQELEASGFDDKLIVIGMKKSGGVRLMGDLQNAFEAYGILTAAASNFYEDVLSKSF